MLLYELGMCVYSVCVCTVCVYHRASPVIYPCSLMKAEEAVHTLRYTSTHTQTVMEDPSHDPPHTLWETFKRPSCTHTHTYSTSIHSTRSHVLSTGWSVIPSCQSVGQPICLTITLTPLPRILSPQPTHTVEQSLSC